MREVRSPKKGIAGHQLMPLSSRIELTHGEDEGERNTASDGGEPDGPVGERVRGEVLRATKESNEEHFGADVGVDGHRDEQSRKSDSVRNLFDHDTSGAERGVGEVLPAVVVDNDADGKVSSDDESLAAEQGLVVVPGLAHLADDVEELA